MYFDPHKDSELAVDAIPTGLGAILSQRQECGNWAPVAYAIRTLMPTEQRYSHIEKEAITMHWGCQHFHPYLYGQRFKIHTDHKPLIPLFKGSSSKPPPRIEKWLLQLQEYHFDLEYRPGSQNPADYLSRHAQPATSQEEAVAQDTEEY